jgi:zinc-ribbon domain
MRRRRLPFHPTRSPQSFHPFRVDRRGASCQNPRLLAWSFGFYPRWLERYMSYCVDCGRELPASAVFCGRCGAPVQPPVTGASFPPTGGVANSLDTPPPAAHAPATPPAGAQVLEPRPTPQPSAPSSSATKRFIQKPAVLIAAAVIVLGVAAGLLHEAVTGSSSSSAQSVASTLVADLQQGNFSKICVLALPAQQLKCNTTMSQFSVQHVTYKNLVLGTVTVNGGQALLEMTGSVCAGSGQCMSNSDPNVAMSAGQTFQQAYAEAAAPSSSTVFSIALFKQNGTWYVTGF